MFLTLRCISFLKIFLVVYCCELVPDNNFSVTSEFGLGWVLYYTLNMPKICRRIPLHNKLCTSSALRFLTLKAPTKMHGRIQRGGGRGSGPPPPPLKIHKNIGFLSNAGPDPLKNHKATKLALNVGPTSNAI